MIDDEELILEAMKRALRRMHDVVGCVRATDALELIRQGNRFDVIFCDVMMPGMDGIAFSTELERQYPKQADKLVFLSGGVFSPRARSFLDKAQYHHIEKPFDAHALGALVNQFLDR